MKSFKNFVYFIFILLFLSCSSQITDATKTDFSVSIDLGFITNPKNGRVKGLNEVSLDRTYFSSIIKSQKQNNSRSVTNQNDSIEFKLYDVTNLQLSQDAKFEDVENFFQQSNIEPLFQEETVIVNQKAQVQFKEVDVGIKALILVECAINNADDLIFYNGKSNIFEIKAGENPVTITLSKVVVADPDPEPEPDSDPDDEADEVVDEEQKDEETQTPSDDAESEDPSETPKEEPKEPEETSKKSIIINFINYDDKIQLTTESNKDPNSVTLTVESTEGVSFSTYEWYVNGEKQSVPSDKIGVFTFFPKTGGIYSIMVIAKDGENKYSATVQVIVNV